MFFFSAGSRLNRSYAWELHLLKDMSFDLPQLIQPGTYSTPLSLIFMNSTYLRLIAMPKPSTISTVPVHSTLI